MSEGKSPEDMTPAEMQAVAKRFNEQQRMSQTMRRKIDQLDKELQDHVLVLQQLENLDAGRRCFRLIGGVLVERTVGEVRPLIETQKAQLLDLLNKMAEELKKVEDEVRRTPQRRAPHHTPGTHKQHGDEEEEAEGDRGPPTPRGF